MIVRRPLLPLRLAAIALVAALGACESSVTDAGTAPQFNTTPSGPGQVLLKKSGPAGSTATFSISATGGTLPQGSTLTLNACPEEPCEFTQVWFGDTNEEVTITEVDFTGDLILERIHINSPLTGIVNIFWPEDPSVTVQAGADIEVAVVFKNIGEPPAGFAGCTPGFWKQTQHFEYWTAPYTPATAFGSVFADAFPGMTLHTVLGLGGGGLEALGRHSVAALLNAASPDVDYGMTAAQVISAFNAAYASHEYEAQKDVFEALNERECTAKVNGGSRK